jgi:secreted trypsin-like serine protease
MVIYGLVSYGVKTCGMLEGYPGVYTKISKYIEWILDNMSE